MSTQVPTIETNPLHGYEFELNGPFVGHIGDVENTNRLISSSFTLSSNRQFSTNSSILSEDRIKPSGKIQKLLSPQRKSAVVFYVLFLILSPLAFRYIMSSSDISSAVTVNQQFGVGNATITALPTWNSCTKCNFYSGFTLEEIVIEVYNVTSPDLSGGFPSIAVFASHDLINWFNFFSPTDSVASNPYIQSWDYSKFTLNQTLGLSCLGNVENSYLVVCLNVYDLANSVGSGMPVGGPPFSDRCFQVYGVCGAPCFDFSNGPYPFQCSSGIIANSLLVNGTTSTYGNDSVNWGNGLSVAEWVVIITIFFDAFSNILRFLSLLSGNPTTLQNSTDVICFGKAVFTAATPIVGEDDAILLRGLIGRTATALHTIGGQHDINGLYLDIIVNERRSIGEDPKKVDEEYNRLRLWWAWINFIRSILNIQLDQSKIHFSRTNGNDANKKNENEKGNCKIKVAKGCSAHYNISAKQSTFKGITFVSANSGIDNRVLNGNSNRLNNNNNEFNITQLLPLICFLDAWLEEIKKSESSFNYLKKEKGEWESPITSIFKVAPYTKIFTENIQDIQNLVNNLEKVFNGTEETKNFPPGISYDRDVIHLAGDLCHEEMWTIYRTNMSTWSICWTYLSRAKVKICKNPICSLTNNHGCNFIDIRTYIDKGSIVYLDRENPDGIQPHEKLQFWIESRSEPYIVTEISKTSFNLKRFDGNNSANELSYDIDKFNSINLLVPNAGKAGALNTCLQYVRLRTKIWSSEDNIKLYFGVIDARHMLAEPEIFWNEAIPFFSKDTKGENIKDYGDKKDVILVQYPQFFCNVSNDDYLDNKNSGYYTLWQTLRDCSKTITSSGTNAIWDATEVDFSFATTSRIEDTGTSHKYLHKYISVHIPCFAASGVAKATGDYIEAVYRWSTGAVELFWASVFTAKMIRHYLVIFGLACWYAYACFVQGYYVYPSWIFVIILMFMKIYYDQNNSNRPLRNIIVSCVIVTNTMYWVSNLLSVVWVILIPAMISFYANPPFTSSSEQVFAWVFIALFIRLPPALMSDRLISIVRKIGTKNDVLENWNFNGVLWRSSQLYVCSFGYTFLSILSGSYTAFRAARYGADNTLWNSFKVPGKTEIDKVRNKMTGCDWTSFKNTFLYIYFRLKPYLIAFAQPEILTKWNALGILLFQLLCITVSVLLVNGSNATNILITLIVCGLNIFLVIDIALLLFPIFDEKIGRTIRPEYAFAGWVIVTVFVIISKTSINYLPFEAVYGQ